MKTLALVLAMAFAFTGFAGCFGKQAPSATKSGDQIKAESFLGNAGSQKFADAAAIVPKNFSFPDQKLLAPLNVTFKGAVATDAMGGYEAERDAGGIDYNTVKRYNDISNLLPPGQPAELVLKLFYDGSEFNSADIDIAVDVPGLKTSYSNGSETFNWNYVTKTMVVDTVGVAGQPAQVGVQIASAVASKGFDYKLDVFVTYVKDVLTPYHAWALDVPPGASGLIIESERAGGDEHVTSQFVLIDPEDNLVQYLDFNDISIPTQSVFIPVAKPGTYVFFANSMHGGFLRAKADVPLQSTLARPLPLVLKSVADSTGATPGVAGHDWLNGTDGGVMPKDDVGASTVAFAPEGPFPLRVLPYVKGQAASMAKIRLSSPLGVVAERTVLARYEDDRGTIGYTSDHSEESEDFVVMWKNIQKGAWKADVVNDNPAGLELGHTILTYQRGGS